MYRKVLLKLSGEMLGLDGKLFDHAKIDATASVLCRAAERGIALGVVIGAGNIWRGRQGTHMDAVTADHMGMLGTVINCLAMRDAVERCGGKVEMISALGIDHVCRACYPHEAAAAMQPGQIVLFAGGTGNPFFSTDTGVVLRAAEVGADAILLAKNIDGVYTADPRKDPQAKLIREISYTEAQEKHLGVMDAAAFAMCAEQKIPVVRVFALDEPENILKVLDGDPMGTVLHPQQD